MDIKHQSLVLDINETRNYTLIKACQGDQKSRYIDCTLTQNGSVLSLTSNYRAIVKASINNEVKAINSCTIDTTKQVIVVELTSVMLDTPGVLNCEITVQDGQQIVTSQAFAVQVRQSTVANETEIKKSKEYGALVDALSSIADVESKADKVQGLVDNIDKLNSADDIINRLSTSETNIETNKASIKELSELVQEVKNSAIAELEKKENLANKVNEILFPSTDFYPSSKAVFDYVNSKLETPLADIESLKADKLDKTDFNTYKTATDKAVAENTNSIKALDSSKSNLVQSRNLFDIKEYLKLLSTQQGPVTGGLLDSFDNDTFTITATKNDCYTNIWSSTGKSIYKIEVEADTDYVLSWDCEGATGNIFVFYNAQATVGNMVQVTNTKKQIAFRTNSDTEYITVRFGVALANNTTTYCRIQLEKGNSKSSYTPHQVAVGVQELDERVTKLKQEGTNANDNLAKSMLNLAIKNTANVSRSTVITDSSDNNIIDLAASVEEYHMCIYGKNLINFKSFASAGHKNTYVIADTYKIDESNAKIEYDISVGNYCGLYYRCKEFVNNSLLIDKDVTISCVVETNKKCKFRLVDESTNKYVVKDIEADEPTRFSLGIKLKASDKAIAFYAVNVEETTHIVISEIMFELNSVCTEYEEYKSVQEVSNDTDLSTIKTNYPTTTVLCDCDCQITYITDTKNYIDNKILEVATALVASESEVM